MFSRVTRVLRPALALATMAIAACSDGGGNLVGAERPGVLASGKAKPGDGGGVSAFSYYCSGVAGFYGYQIAPYCTGGPFGGFQSTSGTGYQSAITITFANTVSSVTLTALDPDYFGNSMVGYDSNGNAVASVLFYGDNAPGTYTTDTRTISYPGIKTVVLTPNSSDYIAYDNLSYY